MSKDKKVEKTERRDKGRAMKRVEKVLKNERPYPDKKDEDNK